MPPHPTDFNASFASANVESSNNGCCVRVEVAIALGDENWACDDTNSSFSVSDDCTCCCFLAVSSAKKKGVVVTVFVFVMAAVGATRGFVLVEKEVGDGLLVNP